MVLGLRSVDERKHAEGSDFRRHGERRFGTVRLCDSLCRSVGVVEIRTVVQVIAMAEIPAIEGSGLTKVYGPTLALADASLVVQRGEIHGLLGENGAGKSTLVRILAGVESPDAGEVRFFGKEAAGGVVGREKVAAFIHQDLALFREMLVADNIALVGGFDRKLGLIDESGTGEAAEDLIGRLGMRLDPKHTVGELTLAD